MTWDINHLPTDFDREAYLRLNPDVAEAGVDPIQHYVKFGQHEGRIYSTLTGVNQADTVTWDINHLPTDFDREAYLRLNPDVAEAGVDPIQHYIEFGQQEGRIYSTLMGVNQADIDRLNATELFDEEFYSSKYQINSNDVNPAAHYLAHGGRSIFDTSLYFRADWYCDRFSEARRHELLPVFHYANIGWKKGHLPNPFFEPDYFVRKYGHILKGEEPLKFFIRNGHTGEFDPSPRFDAFRYIEEYPDCEGVNPLLHYLTVGIKRGYRLHRAEPAQGKEILEAARIEYIKRDRLPSRCALFVTHSPNGHIKPHVPYYVSELVSAGMPVILIVAADKVPVEISDDLHASCTSIVVRENIGFDFSAWAHVIKDDPRLLEMDELLLTNDSVVGPVGGLHGRPLANILEDMRALGDVSGLIENHEYVDHLQSFFLLFTRTALRHPAFRKFFAEVVNYTNKDFVIRDYEIALSSYMAGAGLKCGFLFAPIVAGQNATIFHWRELLEKGFPFIKMEIIKIADMQTRAEFREVMTACGYDDKLVFDCPPSALTGTD